MVRALAERAELDEMAGNCESLRRAGKCGEKKDAMRMKLMNVEWLRRCVDFARGGIAACLPAMLVAGARPVCLGACALGRLASSAIIRDPSGLPMRESGGMVDALALGASGATRESSSLSFRTSGSNGTGMSMRIGQ